MDKTRAIDALRLIRERPRCWPPTLAAGINLRDIDADGNDNPARHAETRAYRTGYVVGWLHGKGLIKIEFASEKIPRGPALLSITAAGRRFIGEAKKEEEHD